jgi:hypothetical protein
MLADVSCVCAVRYSCSIEVINVLQLHCVMVQGSMTSASRGVNVFLIFGATFLRIGAAMSLDPEHVTQHSRLIMTDVG